MREGINEKEEKILQQLINNKDIFYFEDDFNNIIRPLVGKVYDLYQKEKEKNKDIAKDLNKYKKECYLQGKEDENKAMLGVIQRHYISKDNIRELLEKYDKNIAWDSADDHYYFTKFIQELLEENNEKQM